LKDEEQKDKENYKIQNDESMDTSIDNEDQEEIDKNEEDESN